MHTRRHRGSRKIHRRRTRGRNTRMHRRHKGGFLKNIMANERVQDGLSRVKRLTKVGSAIPDILARATEPHPKIQVDDIEKEVESARKKLEQLSNEEEKRKTKAQEAIDKQKGVIAGLQSKINRLKTRLTPSQTTK